MVIGNYSAPSGYTFIEWNTSPAGDGTSYQPGDTVYPTGDMTLYAIWRLNSYTIAFDTNGGTGSFTELTKGYDQDLTLHTAVPTREGYEFLGWCASRFGVGTRYPAGGTFSGNASVTLYAIWGAELNLSITNGTMTYQLEGEDKVTDFGTDHYVETAVEGSHPNAVLIFTPGDGYEIVAVRHTVDGVEQTGGFSESSYVCTIPSDGITADTIIAVTTALKTYTVSYDVNSGKETFAAQTKEYGKDLTLAATSPSRDGYSFTGWLGSDGKTYQPGAAYTENAALTLTAQWKVNQYTITFDTDGGNTIEAITQDYGTAITKPADPTKEGYTFAGWVYGDGGEATVPATMPAGNLTLKAIWTGNPYVVAFDGNGATGGDMTVQTFTYGDSQKLTANAYTRTGYQFLGWAKSADAASAEYSDGASVSNLTLESSVTLYAVWQKISYTVTYNTNGGEPITAENVLYGDAVPLPTPEWDASKHQFVGWQYDEDIITSLTMPANDITLTAVWKHKYTVKHSYETLSGTDAVETETFWGAAGAIAAAETKVKTGYELFGDVPQVEITAEGDAVVNIEYKLIRSDITYEFSGNVPANAAVPAGQKDVPYGTEITLPIVSAEGYAFGGWFVGGEKIGDTYTMPATDIKFTGIYTYVDYDITLSGLDGATIENQPTKYNISQTVVLPTPTKADYVFVGWRDVSGTIIANTQDAPAIPVGSTGSKTFTAVWRIATADLTIEISGAAGQSHIFTVSGTDIENNPVSVKVAVLNGSATITNLPYGEYSVTSDETWSWRYDAEAAVQNVENFSGATVVEFVFTQDNGKWLSGLANRVYTLLTKSGNE